MPWVDVAKERAELMERQVRYGFEVAGWLRSQFPELCQDGLPHPAAVVGVVRLHAMHGKGCLTRSEHGEWLRGFVRDWCSRLLGEEGC